MIIYDGEILPEYVRIVNERLVKDDQIQGFFGSDIKAALYDFKKTSM